VVFVIEIIVFSVGTSCLYKNLSKSICRALDSLFHGLGG